MAATLSTLAADEFKEVEYQYHKNADTILKGQERRDKRIQRIRENSAKQLRDLYGEDYELAPGEEFLFASALR